MMNRWWTSIVLLLCIVQINADAEDSNHTFDATQPYCFRFTWLGPKYDSNSVFMNKTCEDAIGEKGTVPCTLPLVVSENGRAPNTTWMWETHHQTNVRNIACRLTESEVCLKFSYKFNGAVENSTYYCGKVTIKDGEVVRSGCYSQFENGRETEVCACKSTANHMPCNSTAAGTPSVLMTLAACVAALWTSIGTRMRLA